MKNRIWIIIFSGTIAVCSALWLYFQGLSVGTNVVGIYKDGTLAYKIDLDTVTTEREITIDCENGSNTILVSHGSIRMKLADCPDKICVNHGELKSNSSPIVCLPHRIIIKYENSSGDTDAKAGVAG